MNKVFPTIKTNRLLRRLGAKYILMHCNSTYPAPFQDVQLQLMSRLGTALYGYSGHERGIHVAIAAVARGANSSGKPARASLASRSRGCLAMS